MPEIITKIHINPKSSKTDNYGMKRFIVITSIFIISFLFINCASKPEVSDATTENQENFIQTTEGNEDVPETFEDLIEEEIEESKALYTLRKPSGPKIQLKESWGYVMQGREDEFDKSMPLTDVCYFAADINCYGELMNVPSRSNIKVGNNKRCHLVIACDSRAAVHQSINPNFSTRNKILKDIVKAASNYDGVQLDLEYIPLRDKKHFITFIGDLRFMLKGKFLSVCVPARFKQLSDDMYPYSEIALYCDRVFVMAYDEHWSTSRPGAIANIDWCKRIAEYAVKAIPERKLIMGIPFYGRTWAGNSTSGAWYFSGINRILTENQVEQVTYIDDVPSVNYKVEVDITGYFNDASYLVKLCQAYNEMGIKKIGYWRIGQEDPEFWNWVDLTR